MVYDHIYKWVEQIRTQQVMLVVELLIRRSGNYTEILKDKIFQRNIN